MITCTGWTYEYIDEFMTIPRLREQVEYFKDFPPTHVLMAARLGIKPKKKGSTKDLREEVQSMRAGRVAKKG